MLVARGADVNATDNDGETPLHMAAETGQRDVAEWLLGHKADINARDGDRRTPLHIAAMKGKKNVVDSC